MAGAFEQACQLNAPQLAAHCATHTFSYALAPGQQGSPYLATMPGLCRNTGERNRDVSQHAVLRAHGLSAAVSGYPEEFLILSVFLFVFMPFLSSDRLRPPGWQHRRAAGFEEHG